MLLLFGVSILVAVDGDVFPLRVIRRCLYSIELQVNSSQIIAQCSRSQLLELLLRLYESAGDACPQERIALLRQSDPQQQTPRS